MPGCYMLTNMWIGEDGGGLEDAEDCDRETGCEAYNSF